MTEDDDATEVVEHRLALVMNGGVSLAVWMGGVTCELDNVRRASNGLPLPDDASETERRVRELWVRATQRARVRVSTDVIAGTSAGGLNGVLLATAVARGASLAGLRAVWLTAGQLSADALLKPQDDPQSLLNGDFFHHKIAEALAGMTAQPEDQRRDVSLIVTSTALGPSARPVVDSRHRPFSEPDHRRRFHFTRHRARATYSAADGGTFVDGQATDHFGTDEPLATVARATASFPAAFGPVRETRALRERRVWPDWPTGPDLDWFADGGILDNAPFQPVLDSIEHKPVDGAWRRTLCYVAPSATDPVPSNPSSGVPADLPPSWLSVVAAAMSLPGEVNFRDDIEQLHRTIRAGRTALDVRRFRSLIDGDRAAHDLRAAREICEPAIVLYRQSCVVAAIYQVRDVLARSRPDGYLAPASGVDRDLPLYPGPRPWLPAAFPPEGASLPRSWDWGTDAAARVVHLLLRSLSPAMPSDHASLRRELSDAQDKITAIRRAIDARVVTAANGPTPSDLDVLTMLDDAYRALAAPALLATVVGAAVTAFAGTTRPAADVLAAALAVEVSDGAGSSPSAVARPLFDFDRLGLDDPPPLLLDAYNAAFATSAAGATAPSRNNILYGSRIDHFAAFAKPEWREWDWLWGRIDGLAHLAGLLDLDADDVDELARAIIADEGRDVDSVRAQIGEVVARTPDTIKKAIEDSGDLAPAVDALLALVRNRPQTDPALPTLLTGTGQLISDMLARHGHEGHVDHEALRLATVLLRHEFWKKLGHRDAAGEHQPDLERGQ